MELLHQFKEYVKAHQLMTTKDRLLIAVSGGPDSVALCHLCHAASMDFAIAHANFQLRGIESENDEQFVRQLAEHFSVPFFSKRFDVDLYMQQHSVGVQEAARELRYSWFNEILSGKYSSVFDLLLTAHHADDNIETLMMNFFKGTGVEGLKAIEAKRGHLVRPLLFAFKEDILAYLQEKHIAFREDTSNASSKYTRNYFRNELIPGLENRFPQVRQNLLSNISRFGDIAYIYHRYVSKIQSKIVVEKGEDWHIPVLKLKQIKPLRTTVFELMKQKGFGSHHMEGFIRLLDADTGKYMQSETHRVLKNRNWWIVSPLNAVRPAMRLIEPNEIDIAYGEHRLQLEQVQKLPQISKDSCLAHLNLQAIKFPLILRPWKQGDYFYPLGMKKKKKVSRFLIDEKLSMLEKEKVLVLESEGRIIWIVGYRLDDRFRIQHLNQPALLIRFQ